MLLHSHAGEIHLLPAIPKTWQEGEVQGLCARGGFTLRIKWTDGLLEEAELHAANSGDCVLRGPLPIRIDTEDPNITYASGEDGTVKLKAEAGKVYRITPKKVSEAV